MAKKKVKTPEIGTTCPALVKENYEYHLSGDCDEFCLCSINDKPCRGRVIGDPEDASSRFFSRGMCNIDLKKIKRCPVYGVSKETFEAIIRDRAQRELDEKLNTVKSSK